MNEVFLDTEITGLSFNEGHKIVEIACIETQDLIPTGNVFITNERVYIHPTIVIAVRMLGTRIVKP